MWDPAQTNNKASKLEQKRSINDILKKKQMHIARNEHLSHCLSQKFIYNVSVCYSAVHAVSTLLKPNSHTTAKSDMPNSNSSEAQQNKYCLPIIYWQQSHFASHQSTRNKQTKVKTTHILN